MKVLDRLSRFIQAEIDYSSNNPEEVVNKCIKEIELAIVGLRNAIAKTTADKKHIEEKSNYHKSKINIWQQKAELALATGNEKSAREALIHKQFFKGNVEELDAQIKSDKSINTITYLQKNLFFLEIKLADYKLLQAKYNLNNCLKAYRELSENIGKIDISNTLSVFELIEAESQFTPELDSISLEQKIAQLEATSDPDGELAVMKALLNSSFENLDSSPTDTPKDSYFDADLKKLKKQLNDT